MKQLLLVFVGGGFGSVLRFVIGKLLHKPTWEIPLGTLAINVVGSFIIGIVLGIAIKNNSHYNNFSLLLATGFCGGFTTFSAFTYENYTFLKNGDFMNFALYTIGSIVLGIIAVLLGLFLVKT